MRIRNISIVGLFGIFDHEIPLFQREPITIIHGPNGVGKTSLLKLITGSLRPSPRLLRSVPFERLGLRFDDDSTLDIRLESATEDAPNGARRARLNRPKRNIHFRLLRQERVIESFTYIGSRPPNAPRIAVAEVGEP